MKGTIVTKMLCLILCMITVWVKKKKLKREQHSIWQVSNTWM